MGYSGNEPVDERYRAGVVATFRGRFGLMLLLSSIGLVLGRPAPATSGWWLRHRPTSRNCDSWCYLRLPSRRSSTREQGRTWICDGWSHFCLG